MNKKYSVTRALKNAKYLQKVAPEIFPKDKPVTNLYSIIPYEILSRLHIPNLRRPKHPDARIEEILKKVKFPVIEDIPKNSLFNGTLYFVRLQFKVAGNANYTVSGLDIDTIMAYATLAVPQISRYASQYGPNNVAVSPNAIDYEVTLLDVVYDDAQIQGWLDQIFIENNLPSDAAVVLINPPGVINATANPAIGEIAYHSFHPQLNLPYAFVNVFEKDFTIKDLDLRYATALSHEIAEMIADPRSASDNWEVCDPCSSNYNDDGQVYRNYFNEQGIYETSTGNFPPNFDYSFYISSIVIPSMLTAHPALFSGCCYGLWSDWSEVPGDGSSNLADTAVVFQDTLYLFGIGENNHHYMNIFDGQNWTNWHEVPYGGTTKLSDAAVVFKNQLFLFGIGENNHHYMNVYDGYNWSNWTEVPYGGTTKLPDTAVVFQDTLYLFGIGEDGHHYMNTFDGFNWSNWEEVPGGRGTTKLSDAAVVFQGTLYLFGIGEDGHHYMKTFDGQNWSIWMEVPGGGSTQFADTVAVFEGKLYLFGIGKNDYLYMNTYDGQNWSMWNPVPPSGTTTLPNAAVVFNDGLYLFRVGTSREHRHWMATY